MDKRLLHVVKAAPSSVAEADDALRALRHACPRENDGRTLLLFCDLPPCDTAFSPQDDTLIRRLQSGVMTAEARKSGAFLLLVRRRAWSAAGRIYLGRDQQTSVEQVVCELMTDGKTQTIFQAASFSPSSLKGQHHAVLFSDIDMRCTPDTPMRMLDALEQSGLSCVCARMTQRAEYPQSVLARLARAGFSLCPLHAARQDSLARKSLALEGAPRLIAASQLKAVLSAPAHAFPAAQGCLFVRDHSPSLTEYFAAQRRRVLSGGNLRSLLPLAQMALLFLFAALSLPTPALLAMLLPELAAVLHPVQLPAALVRLALLPLTAAVSLDALLCRLLARFAHLRIRLPRALFTPRACAIFGALLLAAAFGGAGALHVLVPVALLWLFAPLLVPALSMPTIERIPLDEDAQSQLRSLAGDAFFDCFINAPPDMPPARQMLVACAGAMLGLLEPDEAARRVQTLLSQQLAGNTPVAAAADQAAMLAGAQYLREHMSECDAALRPLPAQMESCVLSQAAPDGTGMLSLLLRAAHSETSPQNAAHGPWDAHPLDMLFLPLRSARDSAMHDTTLPLTHPHTFLRRQLVADAKQAPAEADSFLALAAAALGHPFHALLMRSSVTAPYMPLLAYAPQTHRILKKKRRASALRLIPLIRKL